MNNNNKYIHVYKNILQSVIDAEVVLDHDDEYNNDRHQAQHRNTNPHKNRLRQILHSTQQRIRQKFSSLLFFSTAPKQIVKLPLQRYRSLLMTAAMTFTILFRVLSTTTTTTAATTTMATTNGISSTTNTNVLLASSSASMMTSNNRPIQDAALSYVQRGGTTTTTSKTTNWLRQKQKSSKATTTPTTTKKFNAKKLLSKNNNNNHNNNNEIVNEILNMERAVEQSVVVASEQTSRTFVEALQDLHKYMSGPKSDTLLLLLATALITPLCQKVNLSPILGFLASGMIMGPNGFGVISGIHTTETLAELGIVFFLFEMGIELSFNRLKSMRRDVFGLGLAQFMTTAMVVAGVGTMVGLPTNANVVLGGGLALSSSAFVLQLLKDKNQLATRFGKAAFGVLLFQDLAVVPLLVVTPILAGSGAGLATALGSALVKAAMALSSIALAGRYLLNPLFKTVAQAQSQEAFLGVVLLTVLSMSFMTEST